MSSYDQVREVIERMKALKGGVERTKRQVQVQAPGEQRMLHTVQASNLGVNYCHCWKTKDQPIHLGKSKLRVMVNNGSSISL